ncbi:MAG: site-specific DNA-methyltransferase [Sphingobium sp.]|nr:site-specific DNA-methyltransferase [Sphingobium sp.]
MRRNAPLFTEYLTTAALRPMPGSPRSHPKSQIRALTKSFEAFGQVLPILATRDNQIISGHAQWEVAQRLAMNEVMVIRIEHLSEPQIKALMVALNRLADLSKWNDSALRTILFDLSALDLDFDIEATGFTEIEIELRIQDIDVGGLGDDCVVLVGDGPAVTMPGDIWQLGLHRLICGDALDEMVWAGLMGADQAAIVVTDPPYNVPIDGHVSGLGRFKHREFACAVGEMTEQEFTAFLRTAMGHAYDWSRAGSVHSWAMDWRHVGEICSAGKSVYDRFLNMAVWSKNQPGMGSFYRSQHELFFIFAKGGAPSRNNIQLGRFGRSRSNIWNYPSAASVARTAEEGNPLSMHPTVKPLALIADILLDSSVRGDVVADPFGGSGTTLIAAEKLGRVARVIEMDPLYCDTIIRRWQRWTGETALRADGLSFAALEIEAETCANSGGDLA